MKSDIFALVILIGLFIATLLLADQRSMEITSLNDRIDLIESQIERANIPKIEISGRAAVYAGSGDITIEDLEDEK